MQVAHRGVTIRYGARGAGVPVLLLADPFDARCAWSDAGYLACLARTNRVLAPELPATAAEHPIDPDGHRPERLAREAVAVLDAENIDDAHIWAYGAGARIAYRLAVEHHDRVRSLVIGGHGEGEAEGRAADAAWLEALLPILRTESAAHDGAWSLLPTPMAGWSDPDALAAAIEGLLLAPAPDLHQLQVPAVLYCGGRDHALPAARIDARALGAPFAYLPGLDRVATFRDVGHVLPLVHAHLQSVEVRSSGASRS